VTDPALSDHQRAVVERPAELKLFAEGAAGTGKTTAAVARLLHLLDAGVPAGSILVVVPQRTLATPYFDGLRSAPLRAGGQVTVLTIGGLARRMVDLFWPLVAREAGFGQPEQPPTFLTLETAQYTMARLVRPLLDEGAFESITIDRNRLYSQVVDDLNKAAVVGFSHTEIGERLKRAWSGEQSQRRVYDEAQECATRFREYCLAHNLLDFSLQVSLFCEILWARASCRDYLLASYPHLFVDNVEEDTPVAHDLLRDWLPHCRSAFLVRDSGAGYRRFLGADPEGGRALRDVCDERIAFVESFVSSPDARALGYELARSLDRPIEPHDRPQEDRRKPSGDARAALAFRYHRYYPEMLDWVAGEIEGLVHRKVIPPGEIVVLAPFLSDALRFSLRSRLEARDVPVHSHRPSRALRDEPATRCLLTLAAIAHPEWGRSPGPFDVAYALVQAVEGLDLVRAQMLTEIVYRVIEGRPSLASFDRIVPDMKERLTYTLGERYERLRTWLEAYASQVEEGTPLDFFLGRLFGEVLSQPGFGFHRDYDAGRVAADLVESVLKFRWTATAGVVGDGPLGREYVDMVQDGVIAAQYVRNWQLQPQDAVLLAPAYTFLMSNRPVEVQFWLDVGSRGWWERLYQPLTHPYVLSRGWPRDALWTDSDEHEARQEALHRLTQGLVCRCRRRVYLGLCELAESGHEQKGQLLHAIQRILRRLAPAST
jgi:hypothetical protein